MTVSLATIIFLTEGLTAPFAVALVLAIITIRDAVGLRRYIGKQGEVINDLVADLDEDDFLDAKYPHLAERIGHTKKQAIVGAVIGLIVSLLGYYLL
jgi:acid phosphatase family membrane protein YuiD